MKIKEKALILLKTKQSQQNIDSKELVRSRSFSKAPRRFKILKSVASESKVRGKFLQKSCLQDINFGKIDRNDLLSHVT